MTLAKTLEKLNIGLSSDQSPPLSYSGGAMLRLITGGEGSGKSFLNALFGMAMSTYLLLENGAPHLVWLVGADFTDVEMELGYLTEFAEKLAIFDRAGSSFSVGHRRSEILRLTNGVVLETVSGYDPTRVARKEPAILLGCEIGNWPKELWDRCRGRLLRLQPSSFGFLTGTFESSLGWLPELWEVGQRQNDISVKSWPMPSWGNPARYPLGRDDPAIRLEEASTSPERFMERFGGTPAPPKGLVVPEFRSYLHVTEDARYDEKLPVHIWIDPGHHVYSVLAVQIRKGDIAIIDELYAQQWTHEAIVNEVVSRPWWKGVRHGVIDVAGTQHHMGMPSAWQAWQDAVGISLDYRKVDLDTSIDRLRTFFSISPVTHVPRVRIHPQCVGFISELGGGPSPVDGGGPWRNKTNKQGQVVGGPEARNNHSCMAFAYGLVLHYGTTHPQDIDEHSRSTPLNYLRGW